MSNRHISTWQASRAAATKALCKTLQNESKGSSCEADNWMGWRFWRPENSRLQTPGIGVKLRLHLARQTWHIASLPELRWTMSAVWNLMNHMKFIWWTQSGTIWSLDNPREFSSLSFDDGLPLPDGHCVLIPDAIIDSRLWIASWTFQFFNPINRNLISSSGMISLHTILAHDPLTVSIGKPRGIQHTAKSRLIVEQSLGLSEFAF